MPLTSRTPAAPRGLLIFLCGAVAGALIGVAASAALTRSMSASARQQNPQYTAEGLEYVAVVMTYAGTALGGCLAMIYLAVRARRLRRQRANQQA